MLTKWLNLVYYMIRRNKVLIDPGRLIRDFNEVEIDKPVFLLGTHGGGLTLISRMLRRNKQVVSVSGNYKYWSGADEMHVVLGPILPFEFTGIRHKVPEHPEFDTHTSWLYATEDLVDHYRLTEEDVTEELREKFRHTLRWLISKHAINPNVARFTDKSQSYTVKVSFIDEILKGTEPRFILITRNPYAVCYRAPSKAGGMERIRDNFTFEELLRLASQHWANSMKFALEDKDEVDHFKVVRFEDLLENPREEMEGLCEFADLELDGDMLPQPDHDIPFGSRFRDRWYPLRPEVNRKYLDEISEEHVEIIDGYVAPYARKFGYELPKGKVSV